MRSVFVLFFFFVAFRSFGQIDTIKPVIHLKGAVTVNACLWEPYTDAGYDVSDNKDQKVDITVEKAGTFANTNNRGLFTLRYKATDKSGNYSYSEYRYIEVICGSQCEACMAVKNDPIQFQLHVYPTISSGIFYINSQIQTPLSFTFSVFNISGQLVKRLQSSDLEGFSNRIDLSGCNNGIYFIRLNSSASEINQKIIIQK